MPADQLAKKAEWLLSSPDFYREAYRAAAARLHPDRNGGDDAQFKLLQAARLLLEPKA